MIKYDINIVGTYLKCVLLDKNIFQYLNQQWLCYVKSNFVWNLKLEKP